LSLRLYLTNFSKPGAFTHQRHPAIQVWNYGYRNWKKTFVFAGLTAMLRLLTVAEPGTGNQLPEADKETALV
jgi:hypothetical protein